MLSKLSNQIKTYLINFVISTIAFIVLFVILYSAGPTLEAQYFPTVSGLKITSVTDSRKTDNMIEITGFFTKNRLCDLDQFHWYAGEPQHDFIRIYSKFESLGYYPQAYIPGTINFSSWEIGISELKKYKYRIFALATYDCHPFWKSVNVLGPIDLSLIYPKMDEITMK